MTQKLTTVVKRFIPAAIASVFPEAGLSIRLTNHQKEPFVYLTVILYL